ncbi:MAG: glycerol-3-phosphate dehydrogenase/oxidase [Reichenbachiella sp.]|uniref:glycerol-3-phosphate dehydrogenase/oxidase n=1 Tax=Reichenbachiella sp. TaxID=2184521 RepID=UPI00326671DA
MSQPSFSYQTRPAIIQTLKNEYYDVIIIGGGITGAGIALDAATRGLKVALLEKKDFASGTSSKSTKLIHGGLRYLKQFEFSLVREVGKERSILHELATHLVRPEKMLLPLIKDGNYGKIITSVGLMVYDVLAGVEEEDQRKMLTVGETMKSEPLLDKRIIEGGGLYAEYQTDDFRLVTELIKTSADYGAQVLNYVMCTDLLAKGGKVCGVACHDEESGEDFKIYGDYVVNATGPWVDQVRKLNKKVKETKLHLTKGIHIVVPFDKLPVKQSVYFDVADGRMIFAIPKNEITYVGTTDTNYKGNPSDAATDKKDVDYLIKAVNDAFPSIELQIGDILSSWAGVRPLIQDEGKSASEISRKDEIFISDRGLISIAGGKLTGYRKMAKRTVDLVLEMKSSRSGITKKTKSKTKKIKFNGNSFKNAKAISNYKAKLLKDNPTFTKQQMRYLVDTYGDQAAIILSFADQLPGKNQETKLLKAELRFCIEREMVMHLTDFFIHRTGRLFFDIQSVKDHLTLVATDMKHWLDWDTEQMEVEISKMKEEIKKATTFK